MAAGTGGVRMDPGVVRDSAAKFGPAGDDLNTADTALQQVINSVGQCWGGDESGQQFAKDYVPAAQQAVQAFGQLAQAMRGIQQNLTTVANSTQGTDTSSAQGISSAGQE